MKLITDEQNLSIWKKAQQAAVDATKKTIEANPNQWYPCGFAWVRIKPARGAFVDFLKKIDAGYTSEDGGYVVHNPSGHHTMWMDAKYDGACACAAVLREHGINATAEQMID
jgi:hypothetical protein